VTDIFTASNGVEIEISEDGYLLGKGDYGSGPTYATAGPEGIDTLREYFQHERDVELGRWRDPENPHMVAYPSTAEATGKTIIRVVNERDGSGDAYTNKSIAIRLGGSKEPNGHDCTAFSYFAAHPEPKPWEDARLNELWVLTIHGEERAASVGWRSIGGDIDGLYFTTAHEEYARSDQRIETARKVWPVDE